MNKPKRKKFNSQAKDQAQSDRDTMICNQAYNDREKFLPNKGEILKMIIKYKAFSILPQFPEFLQKDLATAISKRIRGEK